MIKFNTIFCSEANGKEINTLIDETIEMKRCWGNSGNEFTLFVLTLSSEEHNTKLIIFYALFEVC